MKMLLFVAMFPGFCMGQTAVSESSQYYKVSRQTMGYECPSGYYYNPPTGLCYAKPIESKPETKEISDKRLNASDKAVINIYNYANTSRVDMPKIDVVGDVGVKRRKSLDKKQLAILLDGDWFQEEPDNKKVDDSVDLELTE